MDSHQYLHDLQTTKSSIVSKAVPPTAFDGKLTDFQGDSEDDGSRTPSMTDGSSRTSSVYSASEHPFVVRYRTNSAKSHSSRRSSGHETDSVYVLPEDDNSIQRRQTQSPIPLRKQLASKAAVREPTPLSSSSSHCHDVRGCGGLGSPGNHFFAVADHTGALLDNIEGQSRPRMTLPIRNTFPGSLPAATTPSELQDVKMNSDSTSSDSDSADSNSDSDEESADELDADDDDWSGATDYFETAVLQAVFPDRELAAHLILQLYSLFSPGSSKTISGKVRSWRERIRTCPTDSGTVSTEKGPSSSSNTTSSTSKPNNQKRDRLSSSIDSNIGEDDEDEDDDTDENRRKRLKETNQDGAIVIPTQRLACPFNKMNPLKYCVQFNQEGQINDRYYRICAGPGFRTLQTLKEHLKRKHYPVQCDRCYLIFKVKGNNRSSAVSELEKHRQLDERCPRNAESMKEGISDAQWTSLDEKKQGKKGKVPIEERPRSEIDKWNDIWTILFPNIALPATPWYDNFTMEVSPHPSQGLRNFLEVHAKTVEFKLPSIKAARSDEELKALLLELAQKVFQVWTATARWNEASTSSLSNGGGSDPLSSDSWEQIPSQTPTGLFPSPRPSPSSVFPNLNNQRSQQNLSMSRNTISTDRTQNLATTQVTPQSTPFSVGNVSPNPQGTVPASNFTMEYPLGGDLQAFHQNGFSPNIQENSPWLSPIQHLPFNNNNNASFEDVSMGGAMHTDNYDIGPIPQQLVQNMNAPQWDGHYSSPGFGPYGGAS